MKFFRWISGKKPAPRYTIKGKNNHIWIVENGQKRELLPTETIEGLSIFIDGNDNNITLYKPFRFINSKILFNCQSSSVLIEQNSICNSLSILNNGGFANRNVSIGQNFGCWGCEILLNGRNNSVFIGKDCVFSKEIHILNGDGHPIFVEGKRLPNPPHTYIGNHVWVGMGVYILKGVSIADNTIVGCGSVVTKSVNEQNTAIAGNPAKIIKRQVSWSK